MPALYNEIDPFAADWLERLITHEQIAPGRVDRRSIADLTAADVAGPGQRHFFAGIAGWSLALRLAGVPDDAPIWTGSCPCQGLSDAGQRRGFLDPRHLWPAWLPLIEECRPPIIFGEQVASQLGLEWLDLVFSDLERCGYTVGAADLCAASVGAPHIRQRLFFVAYADSLERGLLVRARGPRVPDPQAGRRRETGLLADRDREGLEVVGQQQARGQRPASERGSTADRVEHAARNGRRKGVSSIQARQPDSPGTGESQPLGAAGVRGRQRRRKSDPSPRRAGPEEHGQDRIVGDSGRAGGRRDAGAVAGAQGQGQGQGFTTRRVGDLALPPGSTGGFWHPADWILCRDPSGGPPVARPIEPGLEPLVTGLPDRVGLLRGYGNSIVPQVAAEFVRASLDAIAHLLARGE